MHPLPSPNLLPLFHQPHQTTLHINPFSSSFYPLPNNNTHPCPFLPMPSSFKLGCGYFPSDSYNCRHHHQHGIIININKKSQHDPNIVLILPIPISHLQLWRIVKTCRPCMNPLCMRRKKTENQVFTRPTIKSWLMCSSVCRSRETCPSISGNLCKCAYHHIALLL